MQLCDSDCMTALHGYSLLKMIAGSLAKAQVSAMIRPALSADRNRSESDHADK